MPNVLDHNAREALNINQLFPVFRSRLALVFKTEKHAAYAVVVRLDTVCSGLKHCFETGSASTNTLKELSWIQYSFRIQRVFDQRMQMLPFL